MIAAMMTAANLGARVTGWGFVLFTIGSGAWTAIGALSGQDNLLVSNAFLLIVNAIGIWRWLIRQRRYDQGGEAAKRASRRSRHADLFTASDIAGMRVVDSSGADLGAAVDALLRCEDGAVSYVVVRSGGLGGVAESLRAVARADLAFSASRLALRRDAAWFESLPTIDDDAWPAAAPTPPRGLAQSAA